MRWSTQRHVLPSECQNVSSITATRPFGRGAVLPDRHMLRANCPNARGWGDRAGESGLLRRRRTADVWASPVGGEGAPGCPGAFRLLPRWTLPGARGAAGAWFWTQPANSSATYPSVKVTVVVTQTLCVSDPSRLRSEWIVYLHWCWANLRYVHMWYILPRMVIVLGDCSWGAEKDRFVWKSYLAQERGGTSEVFSREFPVLSQTAAQEF